MDMMNVRIWPKHRIELLFTVEEAAYEQGEHTENVEMVRCYRCGNLNRRSSHGSWALSRQIDVFVCNRCGIDEALRSVSGTVFPILQWDVVKRPEIQNKSDEQTITLLPVCHFANVLKNNAKRAEICTIRAFYDGDVWVQDWLARDRYRESYLSALKEFASSFFLYEDMADDYTMLRMFPVAEVTSDPAEVNLYSETEHFYVWICLRARVKDYNVYLHFYEKD